MELTEKSIDEMFGTEASPAIMETMSELAEVIAIEDERSKALDKQLKDCKEQLDNMKMQLNELMMANNCANGHKFDNGLYLKPYVRTDVFKAAGVTDEILHEWLRANNLGGIIKETVWWTTLSATMKAEMEQGHSLPEIFNVANKPSVKFVGNGRVKFLMEKNGNSLPDNHTTYEDVDACCKLPSGTLRAAAKKRERDFDISIGVEYPKPKEI